MPSDDLLLNVRQIENYPRAGRALASDAVLLQRGGLGGPYISISPADFVGTALSGGGDMAIAGRLSVQAVSGGSAQFSNGAFGLLGAQKACIVNFEATWGALGGVPIATVADVSALDAAIRAASVWQFNGRTGNVSLWIDDILCAGGAPIFSPRFTGQPRAETPAPWSNSSRLATTGFVHRNSVEYITNLLKDHPFVFSFNGRSGDVVLTEQDILDAGGAAIFDSPTFTGIPLAPTAAPGTNTAQIATTAFVNAELASSTIFAPIDSPSFTGYASAPTAAPGSSTGQIATTAFVQNAIVESTTGVASFNTRTGAVTLQAADVTAVGGALLVSPVFTGQPTAPTAAPGTANAQLATTAYVAAAIATVGGGVASFNTRTGAVTLALADVTSAGGAPLASPVFTGVPIGPNPAPGTVSNQLATCAFVAGAIAVVSFNGRTGAITLTANDISAAGGAILASPAFTGTPTAPTQVQGPGSTALATTAYVVAAMAAGGGVDSFNGRAGVVTLTAADLATLGGPFLPLIGGTLTGPLIGTTATYSGGATAQTLTVNGAAATFRQVRGQTAGVLRWTVSLGNSVAESGANAGSNLVINSFDDTGAILAAPLSIARASGVATFSTVVALTGAINVTAGAAPTAVPLIGFFNTAATRMGYLGWFQPGGNQMVWSNDASGGQATINPDASFQINSAAAYKVGGGAWAAASDERIKTVVEPYAPGLDELKMLNPIVYVFKGNDTPSASLNRLRAGDVERDPPYVGEAPYPGSTHYRDAVAGTEFVGFLAQELEKVCPAMVKRTPGFIDGEKVDDLRQVDVSNMIFLLVNAVKTLAAKVQDLEDRP